MNYKVRLKLLIERLLLEERPRNIVAGKKFKKALRAYLASKG
jgi:hypothetical protein